MGLGAAWPSDWQADWVESLVIAKIERGDDELHEYGGAA